MRFLHADTTQEQANTVTALEEAAALDRAQGDASRSLSASALLSRFLSPTYKAFHSVGARLLSFQCWQTQLESGKGFLFNQSGCSFSNYSDNAGIFSPSPFPQLNVNTVST